MLPLTQNEQKFIKSVGIISGLCIGLLVIRVIFSGVTRYSYVAENLGLAWLALVFAWVLVKRLEFSRWSSWPNIALSILWLFFLPNTWYVLTDLIHIPTTGEVSVFYDITMLITLVFIGFLLGFCSLFLIHLELLKRLTKANAHAVVGCILALSSFAIYLGRDLRWSTWDLVADPSGIILNVSDRIINPLAYPLAFNMTLLFLLLLSSLYMALWQFFGLTPKHKKMSG